MSENVQIALIIAGTIIVILFIFRRQLKNFIFKLTREGVEGELSTHESAAPRNPASSAQRPGVSVSRNKMVGQRQRIDVEQDDAEVNDNWMMGRDQAIAVLGDNPRLLHLHQQIVYNFSLNDFRTLCQHLEVNYDQLSGEDLPTKTQSLLLQARQRQSLAQLVTEGRRLHPELSWKEDV